MPLFMSHDYCIMEMWYYYFMLGNRERVQAMSSLYFSFGFQTQMLNMLCVARSSQVILPASLWSHGLMCSGFVTVWCLAAVVIGILVLDSDPARLPDSPPYLHSVGAHHPSPWQAIHHCFSRVIGSLSCINTVSVSHPHLQLMNGASSCKTVRDDTSSWLQESCRCV